MVPEPSLQPAPTRILVVEDEVLIRALVAEELRDAGFVVIEAGQADEAWSYLAADGQADLLFTDIHMPGSMDGLQLARRVRERYPMLPIILTSSILEPVDARALGRFLPKPYGIERAITVMAELLGRDPRGDQR